MWSRRARRPAPVAEIEARECMADAEIAAARRKAEGTSGGGGGRANAGNKKPKKGAATVAAVAERFVRELVLKNLTSHEHSAAVQALRWKRCAGSAALEALRCKRSSAKRPARWR